MANLEWASGYRHPLPVSHEEERALLAAFGRPRLVLEGVMASGLPHLSGLDLAWRLVWRQHLLVDWDVPLLPTSPAWAAGTRR
ncbi:hypothetical protein ACFZDG_26990 [Kitasatospora xanthocidica]|uniref:hypothetical protein n=1 Tax=Kitasatospora xanthocidica TaxID=83382 RepID=UPI0036E19601